MTQAGTRTFSEQITVLLSTVDGALVRTASAVRIALMRNEFRRANVVTRFDEAGKSFVASVQFLGDAAEEGNAWARLRAELGMNGVDSQPCL